MCLRKNYWNLPDQNQTHHNIHNTEGFKLLESLGLDKSHLAGRKIKTTFKTMYSKENLVSKDILNKREHFRTYLTTAKVLLFFENNLDF